MKSLFLAILSIFVFESIFAQNLINNPGFELGTTPTESYDYFYIFKDHVPNWKQGCTSNPIAPGGSPDIMDANATHCQYQAPTNLYSQNLSVRTTGTKRYVHITSSESILGEISQPLTAGKYKISFYGSKVAGSGYCQGGWIPYSSTSPSPQVAVYLQKSSNPCGSTTPIWTSNQINSIGSWDFREGTFTVDCNLLNQGYDQIEFRVVQTSGVNGVFLDDVSLVKQNMQPTITGISDICSAWNLTFTGNLDSSLPNSITSCVSHLWEIQECSSTGTLIGSPIYSNWISGNPGTYTFPMVPCNKWYRVKLAPSNGVTCEWVETTKIIRIDCQPTISAPDQSICLGSTAVINLNMTNSSHDYVLTKIGFVGLMGTSYSVAPTASSTYTFQTDPNGACSAATGQVNITVNPLPRTSISGSSVIGNTSPITFSGSLTGGSYAQYAWFIQACNSDGSLQAGSTEYASNWMYSNLGSFTFTPSSTGYSHMPSNLPCNQYYKVKLVTVSPQGCWYTQTFVFYYQCRTSINENSGSHFEQLNNFSTITISPNPSTGKFNLGLNDLNAEKVVVYNMQGKVVNETTVERGQSSVDVDLSEYPSGVYMVHVNANGQIITKKVIKE